MHLHGGLRTGLLRQEKFDRVGWGTSVVLAGEQNWDVDSEDILTSSKEAKCVLAKEAVALVKLELV